MQYLFISIFFAAQVAVGMSEVLNSPENPRLKLFSGDEVKGVNNWIQAHRFCKSQGRVLATRTEWCNVKNKKFTAKDVYDGLKKTEQWAPVRGSHQNSWVQIGELNGSKDDMCKLYSEIYEVGDGTDGTKEKLVDTTVYCSKPAACTGDKCALTDVRKAGYYPDPTDCTARCYYSGTNSGSFWERTPDAGKVWDPYCMNSDPLNRSNKPLAGMTGGCFHETRYVDDLSFCSAGTARRQLKAKVWDKPEWGVDNQRGDTESNYILCTLIPVAPEFPQTCAAVYGDPHLKTYDGLHYDNQGNGDYILQQSLDSELNIQGRFAHFSDGVQASVTKAITIDTGREGEPPIEVGFSRGCRLSYWIDGVETNLDREFLLEGTAATGTPSVHYIIKRQDKYLWFPGSGMMVHMRRKKSKVMGCYLNVKVCLPKDIVDNERLVGLLGSPNGNEGDDFMDRDGNNLDHQGKTEWGDAYKYSHENWCLDNEEENMFLNPQSPELCKTPYDPAIENSVKSAPQWLKDICGSNVGCLIDGLAGGKEDSQESVKEAEELDIVEEVEIDSEDDLETEEEIVRTPDGQCEEDNECPQPDCIEGGFCPAYICLDKACVAEEQCKEDKHCPQPACLDASCPSLVCQEGQCVVDDEPGCKSDSQCPQPSCVPGGFCPDIICLDGDCVPDVDCREDSQCPQPDCIEGGFCPTIVCDDGQCVEDEPECRDDSQCPVALCLEGVPCPSFSCVEGECVAEVLPVEEPRKEVLCTSDVEECSDGSFVSRSGPKCEFAACPEPATKTLTRTTPKGGGDPHFRTWTGDKFDYHGECDLVLLDHPEFADGLGMKVHIRTTRIKYYSYIETIALQIGEETLEFSNDLDNYLINGKKVADASMESKNTLAGYEVRRYQKAISVRLDQHKHQNNHAHIDLYYRKNGFPYVKLDDGKKSDVFKGSAGLLGDHTTGKKIARNGVIEISDATEFALEWQVRDTEPMIFSSARFPQFPTKCTPPNKMMGKRLGDSRLKNEAEKVCAAWRDDKDDCVFDVMATRSIHSAEPIGRDHEPQVGVAALG